MRGMFKILENIGCGGCKRIKYHVNTFSTPIQRLSSLPPPPPNKKTNKQTNKIKKTETAPLIRCTWWLTVLTFESVSLSLSRWYPKVWPFQGLDPENSESGGQDSLASYIVTIYFPENSLKIIQSFMGKWVVMVPSGKPLNPPIYFLCYWWLSCRGSHVAVKPVQTAPCKLVWIKINVWIKSVEAVLSSQWSRLEFTKSRTIWQLKSRHPSSITQTKCEVVVAVENCEIPCSSWTLFSALLWGTVAPWLLLQTVHYLKKTVKAKPAIYLPTFINKHFQILLVHQKVV